MPEAQQTFSRGRVDISLSMLYGAHHSIFLTRGQHEAGKTRKTLLYMCFIDPTEAFEQINRATFAVLGAIEYDRDDRFFDGV